MEFAPTPLDGGTYLNLVVFSLIGVSVLPRFSGGAAFTFLDTVLCGGAAGLQDVPLF